MSKHLGTAFAKHVKADVHEAVGTFDREASGFYFSCQNCGNCSPHYPSSAEAFAAASEHVHTEARK